jgi:hypothetical protein
VDEALLAHPDVAQASAFAVPHLTPGEDLSVLTTYRIALLPRWYSRM